jgi:lipoprotein-anchoring transpeptidase ErfK/SrfK
MRRFFAILLAVIMLAPLTAQAREVVPFQGYQPDTIVVVTSSRQFYFVLDNGRAIRYPVGVDRAGMAWHGEAFVAKNNCIRPGARIPA